MYTERYEIKFEDLDMTGKVGVFSFLQLAQHMATVNGAQLGVGYDVLRPKNMCWVAVRAHYEFEKEVGDGDVLIMNTWPENRRHMLYPRMYNFTDEKGETVMKGSIQWSLYGFDRGKALTSRESGIELQGEARPVGFEIELPSRVKVGELENTTERKVLFSDADANGHLNNCYYVSYILDLLPIDMLKKCKVKTLDINYNRQIPAGETLKINYSLTDNTVLVSGEHNDANIFTAKLVFTDKKS